MSKTLKIRLMMILVIGTVIGGISIKDLSMLYTANKKLQDSNTKESYINNVTADFQNIHKSDDDKGLNSLFDKTNLSDNSEYNNDNTKKQETISSNLKKSSNNNSTKEQTITNSESKDTNSNIIENQASTNVQTAISPELKNENNNANIENQTSTKEQTITSSQSKDTNSNINTENPTNTNATLEAKIPTIHYDRTTSIYTDDYNTLLRVEYYMNNKLVYYSDIEEYDVMTKSYIEKIYQCNHETNIDPLIRTDVYVNGNLTQSY